MVENYGKELSYVCYEMYRCRRLYGAAAVAR